MRLDELQEALESASNQEFLLGNYEGLSSIDVVHIPGGTDFAIEIHVESMKGAHFPEALPLANGGSVPVLVDEDFVLPYFS